MPSYEEVRYHFNHYDPFARHMGIELLEVGPEHGVAIMPLDERHRNGMGHAHGGAIFALVDMTFATVSNAAGLYCVNAQTNISYLEPGRIGPLRGEAARSAQAGIWGPTTSASPIRTGRWWPSPPLPDL